MGTIKKVLRCYKCGTILQDKDENSPGYIISDVFNNHKSEILLCNSCFEKVIFNSTPKVNEIDDDFYSILDRAKLSESLVVLVVDLFSFEGALPERFVKTIGETNVLVVGNKRDTLSPKIRDFDLTQYVGHRLRVAGLNIKEVILASSLNDYNIENLYIKIKELRNGRDVYLIGFQHSGKTSIANAFLKHFTNNTNRLITVSEFPGTSLRVTEIPLDKTANLYDVPGIKTRNELTDLCDKSLVDMLLPKKLVTPKNTTLSLNSGVVFGGLAKIDLINGNKTSIDVYVSNKMESNVSVLRGKNLDDLFYAGIKKGLKPTLKGYDDYTKFDIYDIFVEEEGYRSIGILGLGWISFKGNHQTFRVTVPKGVYVYYTRSKVHVRK